MIILFAAFPINPKLTWRVSPVNKRLIEFLRDNFDDNSSNSSFKSWLLFGSPHENFCIITIRLFNSSESFFNSTIFSHKPSLKAGIEY